MGLRAAARGAAQLVLGTKPRISTVWFGCHGSPRAGGNRHYFRGRAPPDRNKDSVSQNSYRRPICPCLRSQRGSNIGP